MSELSRAMVIFCEVRGLGCSPMCKFVVDLIGHIRSVHFIICEFDLTFKKQRTANKYKTLHAMNSE